MSTNRLEPEAVPLLVSNHERFLRFLEPRVGSREAAEDILQNAFVKSLEKGDTIREGESALAWFYRVLRNAVADHYRRRGAEARALGRRRAPEAAPPTDAEMEATACGCFKDLVGTLKPEYADILRRVDLEGSRVDEVARAEKITPNNAMVRLHRARRALHARLVQTCGTCTEHGCLDCRCKG